MLGYGSDPSVSEGTVKPPVVLTATFVFRAAEEGRD
jgi:methionine-gamma-lyase